MKKTIFTLITALSVLFSGCQDLDLNPLTEGSSENWFSTETEFQMAVNELYRETYWYWEATRFNNTDRFSDDYNQRDYLYDWLQGNFTSETGQVEKCWRSNYSGITRANSILTNVERARREGLIAEPLLQRFEGEAAFFRACFYSYLVFLWGDVPFYTDYIYLKDALGMGRTDKAVVLKQIYADFDTAIANLQPSYSGDIRITQGTAYAFKARTAIWMLDWATAAEARGKCMELKTYSLHPDYSDLFLSKTRTSPEWIFTLPRSKELQGSADATKSRLPRLVGGNATCQPSWELLFAYLCTDGKPVDESSLFDPSHPFANRDPRCAATMVEFGTEFLDYIFDPGAKQVKRISTGKMVKNNDSRLVQQYAAFNGMCLKKGVDEEWTDDMATDVDVRIMRYADVLLMYAEAKIELNEIDQSVRDALNALRERAYRNSGLSYPRVTETDQDRLRTIVRMERRMELAWENRRWFDLIRWRLAETALTRPIYCHDQTTALQKVIDSGDYPFPKGVLPEVDADGLVDLSPLYATGKIIKINERGFQTRQYLMPIPAKERLINPNISQNDGY